jgi:hypothetical protein
MTVTKGGAGKAAPIKDGAEKLAPATNFAASGAVIEPAIVDRVDMNHPSVDSNPRSNSTPDMNRIDFNEPSALTPQEEAVADNLKNG